MEKIHGKRRSFDRVILFLTRKGDMIMDLVVESMWKDDVTARVVIKNNEVVSVERFCGKDPALSSFYEGRTDFAWVMKAFKMCLPEPGFSDMPRILKQIGLDEYNVVEMIRRTHGISFQHGVWYRLDGDRCTWEEAKKYMSDRGLRYV